LSNFDFLKSIAVTPPYSNYQGSSLLVTVANGSHDFIWIKASDKTNVGDLIFQKFDKSWAAQGSIVNVPDSGHSYSSYPMQIDASALAGDGFVVAWEDEDETLGDNSVSAVHAQIYASSGHTIGNEFLVNDITAGIQGTPSVIGLADGSFIIAWIGEGDFSKGFVNQDLWFQHFDINGNHLGFAQNVDAGQLALSWGTRETNIQSVHSSQLVDGGFVLTWTRGSFVDDAFTTVLAATFNADGSVRTPPFVLNESPLIFVDTDVVGLPNGGFAVAFDLPLDFKSPSHQIKLVVFDSTDHWIGDTNIVGADGGYLGSPLLAADPEGGVVVGWYDETSNHGYLAQYKLFEVGSSDPYLFRASEPIDLGSRAATTIAFTQNTELAITFDAPFQSDTVPQIDLYHRVAGLHLNGTAAGDLLIGQAGDDAISGGTGNDTISGGAGFDNIDAGDGTDIVKGNAGNDVIRGGAGADRLYGNAGDDWVFGGSGADVLVGGDGDDKIVGETGGDRMEGGLGDDAFRLDDTTDRIIERSGQGHDTVYTSVSWKMAANVEDVIVVYKVGMRITGNALDNLIKGNSGADRLYGGNGDDTLIGGALRDTLSGGAGTDKFVFDLLSKSADRDTIKDFETGTDKIAILRSAFSAFGPHEADTLSADDISFGTKAINASQHLIYNQVNGALYYDDDGNGAHKAVQVAVLSNHAALTVDDFVLA